MRHGFSSNVIVVIPAQFFVFSIKMFSKHNVSYVQFLKHANQTTDSANVWHDVHDVILISDVRKVNKRRVIYRQVLK